MTNKMLLAAAMLGAAICQPALAADEALRTVHVSAANYDLKSPEGRAALEMQVARAVDAVCGKVSDPQEARKHEAFSCRRDALPDAQAQLARLYNGRGNVIVDRAGGR